MIEDSGRVSRREFLLRGGAALAGLLIVPATVVSLPQAAEAAPRRRKGYEFLHAEDITIHLSRATDPRKLNISVQRDGAEIEAHPDVHPARLRRLDTELFRVRYVKTPRA